MTRENAGLRVPATTPSKTDRFLKLQACRRALPSLLTGAGLALGAAALVCLRLPAAAGLVIPLAAASLALDVLDGLVARRLDAATVLGGELDWHVDCALAHIGAWLAFGLAFVPLLAALQAVSRAGGRRTSGRAVIFAGIIALQFVARSEA